MEKKGGLSNKSTPGGNDFLLHTPCLAKLHETTEEIHRKKCVDGVPCVTRVKKTLTWNEM